MNIKNYIQELKRRNVIKSALAYLVVAWLLVQVMSIIIPAFELPSNLLRVSIIVLAIGFPCWLIFSWVYEITPDGIKKTKSVDPEHSITAKTSNRLNYIIIAALFIAIALLIRTSFYTTTSVVDKDVMAKVTTDKSIAVLAFADMSPEKDQEYFSDGISEEILNLLAKIPELKVISRTSSFSFKGKEATTTEIGKTLNVGHILEGSIRKSGNTFRITAQLIKVSDGAHIWSETYDRDMSDIFKIQDEIAATVTRQLKITLLGEAIKSKTVDAEAYNLYLRGKQLYQQTTAQSIKNSEVLLRQSIAIDSSYAPTWVLLSKNFYHQTMRFGFFPIEEGLNKAKVYAEKAMDLDPDNAEAYAIMTSLQNSSWDFISASANIEKSLALEPKNTFVIIEAAINASYLGKIDQAIELASRAIKLDPLDYNKYYNLALLYFFNKQYKEAENNIQITLLHNPNAAVVRSVYSKILLEKGDTALALVEAEKEPDAFWKLYSKCLVVHAMGKTDEAKALLDEFVREYGEDSWPNIASVYAYRGEKDEAFKWLNLAYENRDGSTLENLNGPEMENLWGDPRWNKFINKLGLPKDHGFHMD